MRIGIVGNYGNDNNGDESILSGILQQVKQEFSVTNENITVFSNNTQQTSERYGVHSYPLYYKKSNLYKTFISTYKNNKKYVTKFDLLIIGGGGILMDFYKREAHLFLTYALMAKQSNVPYIVYGCGAGPVNTITGRISINIMTRYAQNVSVRDPESKKLLQKIGVKKDIEVIGDPAFTLKTQRQTYPDRPTNIGVSAVPYYNANYWPEGDIEKYEVYTASMARNLDKVITDQGANITFFATKFPQDVTVTKDIRKQMVHKERVTIIEENLVPERIMEVTGGLDLIIGTRLHSLILATNSETPIIAVSYHTKVKDFMSFVGASDRCVNINDLANDEHSLSRVVEKVKCNWQETIAETKQIAKYIHREAIVGQKLIKKAVKRQ
ncbi:polysaccharide pyruvyl transferase family protein [Sporosarcina sp.]|uniref:polysaccharide pyruvyl transferase family protein n=1 Tax=Sporosarcina sp. TaxID=49982 RepID=UPI0026184233|nr:polysaccharide pyruvyl transferase family protein [Sporosarcina sp.]